MCLENLGNLRNKITMRENHAETLGKNIAGRRNRNAKGPRLKQACIVGGGA